jgi:hypothetical protein
MNDKAYELIFKILDSDLPKEDKSEIVRFYLLPRNTAVKPKIELPETPDDLGPVKQPTPHDIKRKKNPEMAGEEDAMKETLDGVIDGT